MKRSVLALIERVVFFLFFVGAVWTFLLYVFRLESSPFNFWYNFFVGLVSAIGAAVGFMGVRSLTFSSRLGRSLFFLSLGMLFQAAGFIIWWCYNIFIHVEIPYPSFADVMFVLTYPAIGYGLWSLAMIFKKEITRRDLFQAAFIFVAAVFFIFIVVNRPDISLNIGIDRLIFNVLYPLGSSILISIGLVSYRIGAGRIYPILRLYIASLLLSGLGDFLFSYLDNKGLYWNGDVSDFLFAASAAVMALGIIKFVSTFSFQEDK